MISLGFVGHSFLVGLFWSGSGWFFDEVGCFYGVGRSMRRMVQLVWVGWLIVWLEDFLFKMGSVELVGYR